MIELEKAVVRTAYENSKVIPKLRSLQHMTDWQSSSARTTYYKLIQGKPVLQEEIATVGTQVLPESVIEASVNELLDFDYRHRVTNWMNEVQMAQERGDMFMADRLLDNKPMKSTTSKYVHVSQGLEELMELAKEGRDLKSNIVRMPFGQMRSILGDLGPGSLHIVAGPPGSLKSGYSEQFDLHASKKFKGAIFSLEMVRSVKLARYAQHLYGEGVGPRAIQTGAADFTTLAKAQEELKRRQLYIDDKPDNIVSLIDAMELVEHEQSPHYYSIDFLQLLNPLPGETDYQSVKNNVKRIYHFAKKYNKPVILLSQLNRESRKDQFAFNTGKKIEKTPNMADLEGAGTIEQVAHSVLFIQPLDENPDARRLYIAKNRNGESPHDFGEVPVIGQEMNFCFDIDPFYA